MLDTAHFPKATRYWSKGKMYDWSDLTLHPMVHALHYGTSVFEGIRAYPTAKGPAIFRLTEHIDRFLVSAGVAKMNLPYGKEIETIILQTVGKTAWSPAISGRCFSIPTATSGSSPRPPRRAGHRGLGMGRLSRRKGRRRLVRLSRPLAPVHHSQLDMRAKLGRHLRPVHDLRARGPGHKGCDEALFLNIEGRIAEGPGENIFVVKNGGSKPITGPSPSWRASPGRASSKSPRPRTSNRRSARSPRMICFPPTRPFSPGRPWRSSPFSV